MVSSSSSSSRTYEVTSPTTGHSWKIILAHTRLRLIKSDDAPAFVLLTAHVYLKNQSYPKRMVKVPPSVLYDDYRVLEMSLPILCGSAASSRDVIVIEVCLDCVQITQTLWWRDTLLCADTWAHPTKHQSARTVWMLRDTNEYVHANESHRSPQSRKKIIGAK